MSGAILVPEKQGKKRKKNKAASTDGPETIAAHENEKVETDVGTHILHSAEGAPKTQRKEKKKKKSSKLQSDDGTINVNSQGDGEDVAADAAVEVVSEMPLSPTSEESEKQRKKREKREKRKREAAEDESKKEKKRKRLTEGQTAAETKPEKKCQDGVVPSTLSPIADEAASAFLKTHNITIHTPPGAPSITPILSFAQLPIPAELQTSFEGFSSPTPIQACAWPAALAGKDVVGIAETGSGKTLAFGIPALARLIAAHPSASSSAISVLVVAPTRELAIQTHDTLSALGKPFNIGSVAVFGGVPKEPQIALLRSMSSRKGRGKGMGSGSTNGQTLTTRIIVGTPGRILDLVQEGVCDLSCVDYLVLDEADRMLDKGFENDIRNIIASTKPGTQRQTMMFSATWPDAVRKLAATFQRDPIRVTVGSDDLTANSRVEQILEVLDEARSKDQRLLALLRSLAHKKSTTTSTARILVFALYKKEASRVEQMLARQGYTVCALHGDMPQRARMEMLERFKSGATGLMVATDVAARGLDIPNVSTVINYTFPLTIEDYIHRIGRTGRAGKHGRAITFFTGDAHERSLAGEFARVLREGGFDYEALRRFPLSIKKREHSAYGAFFRKDIEMPAAPTKIKFS